MEFLLKHNKQSFNYKQIAFAIEATNPQSRLDIINLLDELVAAEEIQEVGLGKYKAFSNRGTENVGVFVRRSNGKNAVVIDDEQIMVAERNSMHAPQRRQGARDGIRRTCRTRPRGAGHRDS